MHLILRAVGIVLINVVVMTSGHGQNILRKHHPAGNRTARSFPCWENEYPYNGRCCVKCPTGTHVSQHCTEDHRSGSCLSCTQGKDFTAAPNGMEECIPCHPCRFDDQEQVAECTAIRDFQCRCKPNTFCSARACLYCSNCRSCPEGQYVKKNCTPTSDTVCKDRRSIDPSDRAKPDGSQTWDGNSQALSIALPIFACVAIFIFAFIIYRIKKHKDKKKKVESGNENYQRPLFEENEQPEPGEVQPAPKQSDNYGIQETNPPMGQEDKEDFIHLGKSVQCGETEPSREDEVACDVPTLEPFSCDKIKSKHSQQFTEQEWLECYTCLKGNVPPRKWDEMMRHLGLSQVDIEIILKDHHDFGEASYQKLWLWRNQNGENASIWKVLQALDKMNLKGCKENVVNDLIGKGILVRC